MKKPNIASVVEIFIGCVALKTEILAKRLVSVVLKTLRTAKSITGSISVAKYTSRDAPMPPKVVAVSKAAIVMKKRPAAKKYNNTKTSPTFQMIN